VQNNKWPWDEPWPFITTDQQLLQTQTAAAAIGGGGFVAAATSGHRDIGQHFAFDLLHDFFLG
jgi:hypothetical protein